MFSDKLNDGTFDEDDNETLEDLDAGEVERTERSFLDKMTSWIDE